MIKYSKLLFKYINFLLKCKLIYKNPSKKDLLIFDDESYPQIRNLTKRYDHEVLIVRKDNLKKIYFSFKILFLTILNYKGNLFTSYIVSLIILHKPKVVFTFIDNSFKFSEIARIFSNKNKNIKFIALQNGARYEPLEYQYLYKNNFLKINKNKNFYIPTFLSFGSYEKDLYKKNKINAANVVPVGNIRVDSYLSYKRNKKILKKKKQICLLSEHNNWNKDVALNNKNFIKNYYKLYNFTLKYAFEKNMKIIICSKRFGFNKKNDFSSPYYKEKKAFENLIDPKYKKFFKKNNIKRSKDKFQTYKNMEQSEIVVGNMSTLLRESLVLRKKIFSCNTSSKNIYNFPLNDFFYANLNSYILFKKKMNFLLNMPKNIYFKKIGKKIDYLMNHKKSPTDSIQKFLDNELKNL